MSRVLNTPSAWPKLLGTAVILYGSEFEAVIIPITAQHFKMLFRNLIYTGLTRAKKLAAFVGSRTALAMAVRTMDSRKRQTALTTLLN
jgi:exodeoxyribonuclease V alpha subunit